MAKTPQELETQMKEVRDEPLSVLAKWQSHRCHSEYAKACTERLKAPIHMSKAEATVEELVGMIERGELRMPEMQRRYVWRSTRVRDLLDSLYRIYLSGAILLWEADERFSRRHNFTSPSAISSKTRT